MCPPTAPAPNTQILMPLKYTAMRICRFDDNRVGIVSGEGIRDVTAVLDGLPQVTYPLPRHDPFIAALRDLLPGLPAAARRASPIPVDQARRRASGRSGRAM